jgi:acyl dehydratase
MSRLRIALFAALLTATSYVVACSSESTHEDAGNPVLADVVYVGTTTDESLELMLDASPTSSLTRGAMFDAPVPDAKLPAATPATFAWHTTSTVQFQRHTPQIQGITLDWQRWVGVPEALAHGTPLSGKASLLVVSNAKNPKLLRVFTNLSSYTPTAAQWKNLAATGGTLTATVTTASFDTNKLTQDGGPFSGVSVQFSVTP